MLKQVCKIGCLVLVLGLLSFPAWSSDTAGMNTDQLSILTHEGNGSDDCARVNSNDNRLILARGGNGGYGPGDGEGNDGEGPEDGTGYGPGEPGYGPGPGYCPVIVSG